MGKMDRMDLGANVTPAFVIEQHAARKTVANPKPWEIVAYNLLLRAFDEGMDLSLWLKVAYMSQARFKELLVKYNGAPTPMDNITTTTAVDYRQSWDEGYATGMYNAVSALRFAEKYNEAVRAETADVPATQIADESGLNYSTFVRVYRKFDGTIVNVEDPEVLMFIARAMNSDSLD